MYKYEGNNSLTTLILSDFDSSNSLIRQTQTSMGIANGSFVLERRGTKGEDNGKNNQITRKVERALPGSRIKT